MHGTEADITALHEKGISLRQPVSAHGYNETTPNNTFTRPWLYGEKVIANVLGLPPVERVFASRYQSSKKIVIPMLPLFTRPRE